MKKVIVSPSILSADFANLERDIELIQEGGADWVHVDVMDNIFVNNYTEDAQIKSFIDTYFDEDFYHIRNNPYILTRAELEKQLAGNGVEYKKSDGGFFVKGALNGVDKKAFVIQSLSSIFVCMASGVKKGDRILDLCAAPGGKSVFCAQLGAEVTACDIHPHRVSLIEKYAASLNVKLSARLNDATVFNKEFENAFDIVLCDVPCSGFGVVSSKPDIKLFKIMGNIGICLIPFV